MKPRTPKQLPDALRSAFAHSRRPGLVAYVTAGDPSLRFTEQLVLRLAAAGADVIELGVPFSDPIADGPVIQRASQRALRRGTTLAKVLRLAARVHRKTSVPLVLFSYFNPVLQFGLERFAAQAAAAGIQGVLITDLTPEEARDFVRLMRRRGLDTVFLAAPTSTPARLRQIARLSRGFVYLISRRGVTGARADVPPDVRAMVKRLRRFTQLPIAVGFGIARPQQVAALSGVAEGVVVGSALVECWERARGEGALRAAAALVKRLKVAS
ncbi:MAG TPA: tryptophan synthase subunit alpha [Candidatus Xenobia bacterium]|nr:tryptophan synthase subunit alpha [Candidatus Xenobia bacterium]